MSEPVNKHAATRIIHVSDTHLGDSRDFVDPSVDDQDDFVDALWEVVGYAARKCLTGSNKPIDALVHTGDLFENHDPSPRAVETAVKAFNHLDQPDEGIEVPIFLVHGDHDHKDGNAPGIDAVCKKTHAQRLSTRPVMLNDELALYGLHHDKIEKFGPDGAAKRLQPLPTDGLHTLLCTHVMRWKWNYPGKPLDIHYSSLRRNAPFNPSVIAAGDVHKRKCWQTPYHSEDADDRSICLYAGATLRHTRKDAARGYEPSAWWLEFDDNSLRRKPIPIEDAVREYHAHTVKLEAGDDIDEVSQQVFSQVEPPLDGAVLRIKMSGEPAIEPDEVEDFFESRGAFQATAWQPIDVMLKA